MRPREWRLSLRKFEYKDRPPSIGITPIQAHSIDIGIIATLGGVVQDIAGIIIDNNIW